MKKVDIVFLISAIILTIFLNAHYISGLYYDHDVANYAYNTLKFCKIFRYLINRGLFSFPLRNIPLNLTQSSAYSLSGILPPGINFIFLAAFSLLGRSFTSIQIFSLIANVLSVFFLYLFAKYVLSKEIRFYFLLPLFYGLFSIQEAIQGHTSNAETFLNTFEIVSILFLGLAVKDKKNIFYLLSGFLLGLGFLIKQSAFATFVAGLVFIFAVKIACKESLPRFFKKIFFFAFLFLAPLLLISIYLLYVGMWHIFVRNPFLFSLGYIKNVSMIRNFYLLWALQKVWQVLKIEIIIFGSLALISIFYTLARWRKPERLLSLFWFIIPTLIISRTGFHFRHHFIEILAPLLTLSVMGISDLFNLAISLFERKRTFLKTFITLGICILVFPFFHLITPLIKKNKLTKSFLLTQRYLKSTNRDKYAKMLLNESYDAGRRFLIAQYIKEHTNKEDEILIWDHLGGGSIYIWSERDNSLFFGTKAGFLPEELRDPPTRAILNSLNSKKDNYKLKQKFLLQKITNKPPIYIVVIKSALPIPNAPFFASQMISLEKKTFKGFFDFLEKNYHLEKDIMGCLAYRLVTKNVQ